MGNEIEPIIFGGATVYNAEKTDVRYDEKNKPIYCVWLEGGAYAEFPEQKQVNIPSYFATDKKTGMIHSITEKTFKANKTTKDGNEYTFEKIVEERPSISSDKFDEIDGNKYYRQVIDGFDGIRFTGTKNYDIVHFSNTSDAEVVVNNDSVSDNVNVMINCKNIRCHIQQGLDNVSRWIGYSKNNGYYGDYKRE